jgi:hypothetical protein
VTAVRTVDCTGWGHATLEQLGIGGPPEALEATVPHSIAPALRLLADMAGAEVLALTERRTAIVAGEGGAAAGFRQTVLAELDRGRRAEIGWHGAVDLARHLPGARSGVTVRIDGPQPVEVTAAGGFADPYPGTAARMLHAALAIQGRPPGLLRLDELPP